MKKSLFIGAMMLALAVSGFTLASVNSISVEHQNLVTDNIEALSQNEGFIISCGGKWGACWTWSTDINRCRFSGALEDYCVNM